MTRPVKEPASRLARIHEQNVLREEDALRRSGEVEARRIYVDAADGKVSLRGNVHSWHERREAVQAAWRAPGVTKVEDLGLVQP